MGSPYQQPLRQAVVEVTNRCNLRCAHCASTSGEPRSQELSLAELRALIEAVAALGGVEVTIIGGEPLMRPDWVEVCEAVRRTNQNLVLVTNGLLLQREGNFAALTALEPAVIGVSLDGATPKSYHRVRGINGFTRVFGIIERLVARFPGRVAAITTFTRSNLRDFPEFVALLDGTGITWQVQTATRGGERFDEGELLTLSDYSWLVDQMRMVWLHHRESVRLRHMDSFGYFPLDPKLRFLHQTWRGCQAGLEVVGIRSNGDVVPCLALPDPFVVANLRRTSLEEIWTSNAYLHRLRTKDQTLTGECACCPYARECRGGCSAMAWSATGDIGENPYCIRRIEVEAILQQLP